MGHLAHAPPLCARYGGCACCWPCAHSDSVSSPRHCHVLLRMCGWLLDCMLFRADNCSYGQLLAIKGCVFCVVFMTMLSASIRCIRHMLFIEVPQHNVLLSDLLLRVPCIRECIHMCNAPPPPRPPPAPPLYVHCTSNAGVCCTNPGRGSLKGWETHWLLPRPTCAADVYRMQVRPASTS